MNGITILEINNIHDAQKNVDSFLLIQKVLVEKHFTWLDLQIKNKILFGNGVLQIGKKKYSISLSYSPLFHNSHNRPDRIFINDPRIQYNSKIHIYDDLSLCLYHPYIDKPFHRIMSLYKIIPWISEWCIHYEEFKKYGVWLGKEIKH